MYPKIAIESQCGISFIFGVKNARTFANESRVCFPSISTDLDDDTRIVRAGRTGKAEDDVVFYMIRDASLYD